MTDGLAVLPLRECLYDCQINRGLDPIFCQETCGALAPGDVGSCTSVGECFIEGFQVPTPSEVSGVFAPVQRMLLLVLGVVVGLWLLGRSF